MNIYMFPALNGDCILVEYVDSRYILIDGGYEDTYKTFLLFSAMRYPILAKLTILSNS